MNRRISKTPDFCEQEKKLFELKMGIMQPVPDHLIDKLDEIWEIRKNEILNTESEWELGEGGRVFYVSASEGDDSNKGNAKNARLLPSKNCTRHRRTAPSRLATSFCSSAATSGIRDSLLSPA